MTEPNRNTAVTTIESSAARPAVPYVLRSRAAEILNSDEARAQIAPLVPHGVDWQHVLLEVHRAVVNNAEILECTQPSIIQAVGQAVQTGLQIGKTIHLVPVNTKISKRNEKPDRWEKRLQAWTDYKGDIELVMWSGAARRIDAQCVYEGDRFEYRQGSDPDVVHYPEVRGEKRGKMIGAYCIAYLDGYGRAKKIVYLPLSDIEKVRAKSKSWSYLDECPDWYAMKTVIHRNCKTLPKTERLAKIMALFAHQDAEEAEVLNPANEITAPATPALSAGAPDQASVASVASDEIFTDSPLFPAGVFPMPFGSSASKGKPIGDFSTEDIELARTHAKKKGGYDDFLVASEALLAERAAAIAADQAKPDDAAGDAADNDEIPF